ncbi:MAG TPA: hypothetical protein VIV35_03815 [Chitinophagaceae bacterium]
MALFLFTTGSFYINITIVITDYSRFLLQLRVILLLFCREAKSKEMLAIVAKNPVVIIQALMWKNG